ncbi:MAG: TonB-dependent receptor plug, partial [Candidatus Angelobacter sp.]|nr:TonB-dependent receptor plug [Candidatus Angelobacter sp.]
MNSNGSIRFRCGHLCTSREPIPDGAWHQVSFEARLIPGPRSILMHGTLRLLTKASSRQSVALCLLVIVTAFEVFAQSASTGALTGRVTDPKGAVVPKATITLRNNGTGQALTTVTDPEGLYRFSLLPPGQYELTVRMAGFEPLFLRQVMIQISEVRRIPIKLAVKGVREVIEVRSPLLQTE